MVGVNKLKKRLLLCALVAGLCFIQPACGEASSKGYVEGEALVLLKYDITQQVFSAKSLESGAGRDFVAQVASGAKAEVKKTYSARSLQADGRVYALVKSDVLTTEELIAELKKNPAVLRASPNYIMNINAQAMAAHPNDPIYAAGRLWGMSRIRANEAWDVTTGSREIYVAIGDTGIDAEHPDLEANVAKELCRDFTNSSKGYLDAEVRRLGHGTHVAGTIGAVGNNGIGVVGVNWTTRVIAIKVLPEPGGEGGLAGMFHYLIGLLDEGCKIPALNLSIGWWAPLTPSEMKEEDVLYSLFKDLSDTNRIVIVVAAGNEQREVGAPNPTPFMDGNSLVEAGYYAYPVSYLELHNMIVVGATTREDKAAYYSNWSATLVDIAAPGGEGSEGSDGAIWSTVSRFAEGGEPYTSYQGTSMAAPHVAGAVALLAAKKPDWTASQLKEALLRSANASINPISYSSWNINRQTLSKHGLLDVRAAMDYTTRSSSGGCNTFAGAAVLLIAFSALLRGKVKQRR